MPRPLKRSSAQDDCAPLCYPIDTVGTEIARQAICRRCGHTGLAYQAFLRLGQLVEYTRCPKCGEIEEF